MAKHTEIYPSGILPSLSLHISTVRLPVFAHISRLYTTVHYLATLVKFISPLPPFHVCPRMPDPRPLQSPLLAKLSKHGVSATARIVRVPSRALSTKYPWSPQHPGTVSSCPHPRPSSPTPLATHSAKTHPSPFPSPLRTSRAHSFPPLPVSHVASSPQLNSCSIAPSSIPPPLQQKPTHAWRALQELHISQSRWCHS